MGILDFLKKGEEKPVENTQKTAQPKATTPTPEKQIIEQEQTYTVVSGDSLSKIAKKLTGNANNWNKIFEANKGIISNPDLIKPGQILKIPKF